jgi:putative transposase
MPNYRRAVVNGGTFFFTVVAYKRSPILCNGDIRQALREGIRVVRDERPFDIDACVLLPDHLHCVCTLPGGDSDFSTRWAMIKRFVSKKCGMSYKNQIVSTQSRRTRNEGLIWQRRFWEHSIRDRSDLTRCVDYVHWNPVKHGHVRRVVDWPYSTFHRYFRAGTYERNWGGATVIDDDGFGE